MSIKWKLMAVIIGPLAMTIGLVAWRTAAVIERQNLLEQKVSSNQELSQLRRFVEERLISLRDRLAEVVEYREGIFSDRAEAGDPSQWTRRLQPFTAVAFYTKGKDGEWRPRWSQRGGSAELASQWPGGTLPEAFERLPFPSVKDGDTLWWSIVDAEQRRHFVTMTAVDIHIHTGKEAEGDGASQTTSPETTGETLPDNSLDSSAQPATLEQTDQIIRGVVVGLVPRGFFNSGISVYKGAVAEVFIVDSQGYVVAHPVVQNWGIQVSEHGLVSVLMSSGNSSGSEVFDGPDGKKTFGRYMNLDHSNLYALWTAPLEIASTTATDLVGRILLLGLVGVLIGLILALWLSKSLTGRLNRIQMALFHWAREGGPLAVHVAGQDEVGQLANMLGRLPLEADARGARKSVSTQELESKIKKDAYRKIGSGLKKELLGPVTSALGNLQILKAKIQEGDEAQNYVSNIEREARRIRETIEKLSKAVGAEVSPKQICDVSEVLLAALAEARPSLQTENIKIIKDFSQHSAEIIGNRAELHFAFLNIFEFSRLSMAKSDQKELKLSIDKLPERVRLIFTDTGPGMTPVEVLSVFDPFAIISGQGGGLNLAFAQGILQEHHGFIDIRSQVGGGNQFIVELPLRRTASSQVQNRSSKASTEANLTSSTEGGPAGLSGDQILTQEFSVDAELNDEPTASHVSPLQDDGDFPERLEITQFNATVYADSGDGDHEVTQTVDAREFEENTQTNSLILDPKVIAGDEVLEEMTQELSLDDSISKNPEKSNLSAALTKPLPKTEGVVFPKAPNDEVKLGLANNPTEQGKPGHSPHMSEDEKNEVVDQVLKKMIHLGEEVVDDSNEDQPPYELDVLKIALEEATGLKSSKLKPFAGADPGFPKASPRSIKDEVSELVGEVHFPGETQDLAREPEGSDLTDPSDEFEKITVRRPKLAKRDE